VLAWETQHVAEDARPGARPMTADASKDPLDLVQLRELMALTRGRPEFAIGLVDGPVPLDHPDLVPEHIRMIGGIPAICGDAESVSCQHGTFVAGILAARRGANAPAIAPDCTLLIRPVFPQTSEAAELPSASPVELASAIVECVDAGARILNLSVALTQPVFGAEHELDEALEYTRRRGVLVITAAGNQGYVGSSTITRHRWVIPVVAYGRSGWPLAPSNMGRTIGMGGLGGPGTGVMSLAPRGESNTLSGTSVAAPFVAGAAALLWSLFPGLGAAEVKRALHSSAAGSRRTIIPPLLNARAAHAILSAS
jgi:subtilisin family serine protease